MKYSNRDEILEKNPFLKRYWLSRVFAGSIISGARMSESDWKKIRFSFFGSIFIFLLFGFNLIFEVDLSTGKRAATAILVAFFFVGIFVIGSACYGYLRRDEIDSSGAFEVDTRSIWPVARLCAGIVGGGALLGKIFGAW